MIYVVSGFWRSGTSLLMQACEAGGMRVYRNAQRDGLNERHSDATYRPNPVSLYEPSGDDLRALGFPRTLEEDSVVKILVGWPMAVHAYRVAVMRRDPVAILESAARAFGEHMDAPTRDRWIAEYHLRLNEHVKSLMNRRDVFDVRVIDFDDLVDDPQRICGLIHEWSGWPLDVAKAAAVVNPDLRRVGAR